MMTCKQTTKLHGSQCHACRICEECAEARGGPATSHVAAQDMTPGLANTAGRQSEPSAPQPQADLLTLLPTYPQKPASHPAAGNSAGTVFQQTGHASEGLDAETAPIPAAAAVVAGLDQHTRAPGNFFSGNCYMHMLRRGPNRAQLVMSGISMQAAAPAGGATSSCAAVPSVASAGLPSSGTAAKTADARAMASSPGAASTSSNHHDVVSCHRLEEEAAMEADNEPSSFLRGLKVPHEYKVCTSVTGNCHGLLQVHDCTFADCCMLRGCMFARVAFVSSVNACHLMLKMSASLYCAVLHFQTSHVCFRHISVQ